MLKCIIRHESVAPSPEEFVRQGVLHKMIHELGYPKGCIVVEKELANLPHIALFPQNIPSRRVDILCYAKGIHPTHELYPLLMIECKAARLNDKVLKQVVGYNYYVKAPFVSVVNSKACQTGWFDKGKGKYTFIPGLPSYQMLVESLST